MMWVVLMKLLMYKDTDAVTTDRGRLHIRPWFDDTDPEIDRW
jgi:hypothetical protein